MTELTAWGWALLHFTVLIIVFYLLQKAGVFNESGLDGFILTIILIHILKNEHMEVGNND